MSGYVDNIVKEARKSSYKLANLSTAKKNRILKDMASFIKKNKDYILRENAKDVKAAKKEGKIQSFIDRLSLSEERIKNMSDSLRAVADLKDPVGQVINKNVQPNKMKVSQVRVPIGVILIVYEARPNVTSDCVGLLFKTANVGILRGGRSSFYSNLAIGKVLTQALKKNKIDFPVFFVVKKTGRNIVNKLLKQDEYIDLVIPRGGESLIRNVVENSNIPVIKHYKGVCNIFIDKSATIKKAVDICINAKVQRPSVCNAVENIVIHSGIAKKILPALAGELQARGVKIKGDERARRISPDIKKATVKDWSTEYLDLIVSIKIVDDIEEAIDFINRYGSHHTESIITNSKKNKNLFLQKIDSGCCFFNVSTRFSDGYQFGLGAEIGISTDKLHARGPMGLKELTTYKWVVTGTGQIRK